MHYPPWHVGRVCWSFSLLPPLDVCRVAPPAWSNALAKLTNAHHAPRVQIDATKSTHAAPRYHVFPSGQNGSRNRITLGEMGVNVERATIPVTYFIRSSIGAIFLKDSEARALPRILLDVTAELKGFQFTKYVVFVRRPSPRER